MGRSFGKGAIKMLNKDKVNLSYDSFADVLYLSLGQPERSSRTREDARGLLWRVSPDGATRGVTILAFQQIWANRESELARLLSDKFDIAVEDIRSELESTH